MSVEFARHVHTGSAGCQRSAHMIKNSGVNERGQRQGKVDESTNTHPRECFCIPRRLLSREKKSGFSSIRPAAHRVRSISVNRRKSAQASQAGSAVSSAVRAGLFRTERLQLDSLGARTLRLDIEERLPRTGTRLSSRLLPLS